MNTTEFVNIAMEVKSMKKAISELKNRDQMKGGCGGAGSYYSGYSGVHGTSQIFPR